MHQFHPQQLMQQVDTRLFFQGLPHQVPFVLPVPQSTPQLQPYAGQITAVLLLNLQSKAQMNPLRANLWLSCQYQNWQNVDIQRLMAMTCELTNLFTIQYRYTLEQAIATATEEACSILSVSFADRTQLTQYLGAYSNDMHRIRNQANAYASQLQTLAYGQSQYGAPNTGYGYQQPQSTYGVSLAGQANAQAGSIWSASPTASLTPPIASGGGMVGDLPVVDLSHRSHSGNGSAAVPVSNGPVVNASNTFNPASPAVPNAFGFDHSKPNPASVVPTAVPTQTSSRDVLVRQNEPVVTTSNPGVPTMQNSQDVRPSIDDLLGQPRRPLPIEETPTPTEPTQPQLSKLPTRPENPHPAEWVEMEDGTIVVPAALYPELSDRIPVGYQRHVYDVSMEVLMYLIRPDGTVHETLVKRRPEMDFAEHELNRRALYGKQDANRAVSGLQRPPSWEIASRLAQHPAAPLSANSVIGSSIPDAVQVEGSDELVVPNVDIGERIEQFQSLDEARFKSVIDGINTVIEGKPYEYYAEIITRIPIQGKGFNETLFQVRKNSYQQMHEILIGINVDTNELGLQANAVRQTLDRYLTQEINRILQQQLSLNTWSIDSFMEDYPELIKVLRDQFGQDMVDRFESTAKHTKNMMKNMSRSRMIAIGYRASILSVPWTLDELSLDLNQGGALVSTSQPMLYEMISNIFTRAYEDKLRTDRYFIETQGAALIEIRRGLLNPESFMLHLIEAPAQSE